MFGGDKDDFVLLGLQMSESYRVLGMWRMGDRSVGGLVRLGLPVSKVHTGGTVRRSDLP